MILSSATQTVLVGSYYVLATVCQSSQLNHYPWEVILVSRADKFSLVGYFYNVYVHHIDLVVIFTKTDVSSQASQSCSNFYTHSRGSEWYQEVARGTWYIVENAYVMVCDGEHHFSVCTGILIGILIHGLAGYSVLIPLPQFTSKHLQIDLALRTATYQKWQADFIYVSRVSPVWPRSS